MNALQLKFILLQFVWGQIVLFLYYSNHSSSPFFTPLLGSSNNLSPRSQHTCHAKITLASHLSENTVQTLHADVQHLLTSFRLKIDLSAAGKIGITKHTKEIFSDHHYLIYTNNNSPRSSKEPRWSGLWAISHADGKGTGSRCLHHKLWWRHRDPVPLPSDSQRKLTWAIYCTWLHVSTPQRQASCTTLNQLQNRHTGSGPNSRHRSGFFSKHISGMHTVFWPRDALLSETAWH